MSQWISSDALSVLPCWHFSAMYFGYSYTFAIISWIMPEQNSEFTVTMTTTHDMSDHYPSYAHTRTNRKTVFALPPQQQSGDETKSKRCLYHMTLGTPITHELAPNVDGK